MKRLILLLSIALILPGCGYNTFQRRDEQVKQAWSNVMIEYKRRYDLVPNLVATVQGYATHEKGTLEAITQARASVGSIKATPELLNDPKAFAKFTAAQDSLAGTLQRLLMVSERYPDLKANAGFLKLQADLSKIEDDIVKAKRAYTKEVKDYNINVRSFPSNLTAMVLDYKVKPEYTESDAVKEAPKVDFSKK